MNEMLIEALRRIRDLKPEPFQWPIGWKEEKDACAECKRYEGHPIQQGICDLHRKPFWARQDYDDFEAKAIGVRASIIARDALAKWSRTSSDPLLTAGVDVQSVSFDYDASGITATTTVVDGVTRISVPDAVDIEPKETP